MRAWMVRAGDENELIDVFWNEKYIAIGWHSLLNTSNLKTRDEYKAAYRKAYNDSNENKISVNVGQLYRFEKDIQLDDYVLTFDKSKREYLVGIIKGDVEFDTAKNERYPRIRKVEWQKRIKRDLLSQGAKNTLGSVLTVFSIDDYINEILNIDTDKQLEPPQFVTDNESVPFHEDVKGKSDAIISDLVSKLDSYEFQFLFSAILRSMGFKTIDSDPGRDRGVDIIAFKDEFGFEKPRIKVQVKHRNVSSGGPDMRNFISTLDEGEYGIFVSSSGFKGDAYREVEKHSTKLCLYDMDNVIELLLKYYDKLEEEYKAKIPLTRMWIPIE